MGFDHYVNILNREIELVVYSQGGISWNDADNMASDDFYYVSQAFKDIYEKKENERGEFIKSVFEYANKFIEGLFKLLSRQGGDKK